MQANSGRNKRARRGCLRPVVIKDILFSSFASLGLSARLNEYKIIKFWPVCVGEGVARRSTPGRLVGGVLYCKVASPAWMTELTYQKKEISARINRELGEPVVKDIIFRLGTVPVPPPVRQETVVIAKEISAEALGEIERAASVIKDAGLRELLKRVMRKSSEDRS